MERLLGTGERGRRLPRRSIPPRNAPTRPRYSSLRLACGRRAGLRADRAPKCVEVVVDRLTGDLQLAHRSLDLARRRVVCFCACDVAPRALDVIRLRRTVGQRRRWPLVVLHAALLQWVRSRFLAAAGRSTTKLPQRCWQTYEVLPVKGLGW